MHYSSKNGYRHLVVAANLPSISLSGSVVSRPAAVMKIISFWSNSKRCPSAAWNCQLRDYCTGNSSIYTNNCSCLSFGLCILSIALLSVLFFFIQYTSAIVVSDILQILPTRVLRTSINLSNGFYGHKLIFLLVHRHFHCIFLLVLCYYNFAITQAISN